MFYNNYTNDGTQELLDIITEGERQRCQKCGFEVSHSSVGHSVECLEEDGIKYIVSMYTCPECNFSFEIHRTKIYPSKKSFSRANG